jgi:hypothetical protein
VVTVNGQLVGGWKRAAQGVARLDLAARLTAAERRLIEREVRRYEAFATTS